MRTLVVAVLAGAALLGTSRPGEGADPAPSNPPVHIEMKEVEIRGEIERPDVFYIIPRQRAQMELAPLSKDYRDEILEPLLPGPFEQAVKEKQK